MFIDVTKSSFRPFSPYPHRGPIRPWRQQLCCVSRAGGSADFDGVSRYCHPGGEKGTGKVDCKSVSGKDIIIKVTGTSEVVVSDATGELCGCTDDLCNSAPRVSFGRLTVGFSVTSVGGTCSSLQRLIHVRQQSCSSRVPSFPTHRYRRDDSRQPVSPAVVRLQ